MARYILSDRDILTPEAVRAILAKELLLKGGFQERPVGRLIGARDPRCYFVFVHHSSDSAQQNIEEEDTALLTMLASEDVLREEWDLPEEDEAWANLLKVK